MNFFFCSCLASVLCAVAVRVGDDGPDGGGNPPATFQTNSSNSMYLKYDERAGCEKDSGGTCSFQNCNAERGPTTCVYTSWHSSHRCLCNDGYCAKGSFSGGIFNSDHGHYCFQTCGVSGVRCSSGEIYQAADYVCAGVTCSKTECCIPRGKCDGSKCDPATEVPTASVELCKVDVCNHVECCESRGTCGNFVCPSSTTPIVEKTALCRGKKCFTDECCRVDHIPLQKKSGA
eukprot:TRINITY_DN3120_c0_g1_i3.p1 TRINITY_DN3120_c0_g1~~TRINITY_DN3120_c0_g1_i3.p1  ORF type:complete len:232 (+),score=31.78 TRINITY_DN3120_c0_g1_i3:51-746(+)